MIKLNENNPNQESLERIQIIRKHIIDLENVANDIINVLNSNKYSNHSSREILISNVKEFYYHTLMAWEKLNSMLMTKNINLDDLKGYLYMAKSRLTQSISELKVVDETELPELILRVKTIFEKCWNAFFEEFEILEPKKEEKQHSQRIFELSKTMYQLPCSVCGKISVEFKLGYGRFDKEESLVFTGITHSRSLRKSLSETLFEILRANNLSGVHEFMKKYHGYEGLDAYCPECDKIYCWEHYNATEEWEEGFYDCTYGTCPKGHKRMIDD